MSVLSVTSFVLAFIAICTAVEPGEPGYCVPNASFKSSDGCNDCVCNADGTFAGCTLKLCRPKRASVDNPGSPDYKCEPNSVFRWQCNDCTCSSNGIGARCTRRICGPNEHRRKRATLDNPGSPDYKCEPNSVFKWQCNDCTCSSNGVGARCTRRICGPNEERKKRETEIDLRRARKRCKPSTTFVAECNICVCSKKGYPGPCTLAFCKPDQLRSMIKKYKQTNSIEPYQPMKCIPNTTFKMDCNFCSCTPQGVPGACTEVFCEPDTQSMILKNKKRNSIEPLQPMKCTPNTTFKVDCNFCSCTPQGVPGVCTEAFCTPDKKSMIMNERNGWFVPGPLPKCVPNTYFKWDCNTCYCNEYGFPGRCTKVACGPWNNDWKSRGLKKSNSVDSEIPARCTPKKSFKWNCNTCLCSKYGVTVGCTKMNCVPDEDLNAIAENKRREQVIPNFKCKPLEVIMLDSCNKCTCSHNGKYATCTTKECDKSSDEEPLLMSERRDINDTITSCTPGELINKDCNLCICAKDGNTAHCTVENCKSKSKRGINSLRPEDPNFTCEPGQPFNKDCNTCFCAKDGKTAYCTLEHCFRRKRELRPPRVGDPDFTCTPGESFKDDCNTCRCAPNGKNAFCTLKACVHKRSAKPKVGDPDFTCTPGESFPDDCNTCTCTENGKDAFCTLKACDYLHKNKRSVDASEECNNGDVKIVDCNTCRCRNGHYTCLKRFCIQVLSKPVENPECKANITNAEDCTGCYCNSGTLTCTTKDCQKLYKDAEYVCKMGERRQEDCNICNCLLGRFVCTKYPCPKPQTPNPNPPQKDPKECEEGDTKQQDCNTCNCFNGRFVCTKRACITPPKTVSKREVETAECKEGETKKVDCNTCVCKNGKLACTEIGCLKLSKREAEHECEDGETKKEDCNTCSCFKGKFACTKMACPKPQKLAKRETKECEEGDTKQHECNTCNCFNGHFVCTKRACVTPPKIVSKREETVDTEFTGTSCAPNDKFMIDCNTCYCNGDGSGYSCTEMACGHNPPKQR